MRILFISEDLVAGNLSYLLSKEGHDVKLYIDDEGRRASFENMVNKVDSWEDHLDWVGTDGLIVVDSCSHGAQQSELRQSGYSVIGSSELGNRLENERAYADKIFKDCGLKTVSLIDFESVEKALEFVKRERGQWVVKQNSDGTGLKDLNYVGQMEDASDVINVLESYLQEGQYVEGTITLQQKIDGVEIGVGRYFNGHDWVGPIEINLEHKKFFPGDLGPTTSEMGTVAWYDDNEENKLFVETLAKLKSHLKAIDFRGDAEINCIVNSEGAFPLEATTRFGSPIVHLQSEIHLSPWGEFLKAVADGNQYDLKWKKGFGIVIVVSAPTFRPFPFTKEERYVSPEGTQIYFAANIGSDVEKIHFEDVASDVDGKHFFISDDRGYVLYVTAVGETVEAAQKEVYDILDKKVFFPKMFYRNDIGDKFLKTDREKLTTWGYLV